MELSERQKKFLRREAHNLKPVMAVGDKGLTQAFLDELGSRLDHHELLKIRVRGADREERDALIGKIAASTQAELIRRVGNVATLYKANRKKPRLKLPARGSGD